MAKTTYAIRCSGQLQDRARAVLEEKGIRLDQGRGRSEAPPDGGNILDALIRYELSMDADSEEAALKLAAEVTRPLGSVGYFEVVGERRED